jgi:hypothetical protein
LLLLLLPEEEEEEEEDPSPPSPCSFSDPYRAAKEVWLRKLGRVPPPPQRSAFQSKRKVETSEPEDGD